MAEAVEYFGSSVSGNWRVKTLLAARVPMVQEMRSAKVVEDDEDEKIVEIF